MKKQNPAKKFLAAALACIQLTVLLSFFTQETVALEDPSVSNAKAAYLYNFENKKVLYSLNPQEKLYPTSSVKMMTGILAIEQLGASLDQNITITAQMLSAVSGNNAGLKAGEIVTAEAMIRALLVNGANDAAYVLAYAVSGSAEAFIAQMNTKAREIGAYNTYYTNPTGMHDENMYTTAEDTAIIAAYAYKIDLFVEASSMVRYELPATNLTGARSLYNRNCLLSVYYDTGYYYDRAKGMNAGSTPQGGGCVVTTATDGGLTYLAVVLGGETVENTNYAYINAKTMLSWAFNAYDHVQVLSPETIIGEIPVTLSTAVDYVTLASADTLEVYLPSDIRVEDEIEISHVTFTEELQAPVTKGQKVGSVTAVYNGEVLGTSDLIATTDVSRSDILYALYRMEQFTKSRFFIATVVSAVIFSLLYIFGTAWLRQKKNKKRMRY